MGLEWGGHSNGRIPAAALMRVPWAPSHMLERAACLALIEVNEGFRARFGRDLPLTDSYRPHAVQDRIFRQRYVLGVPQGTGDVRRYLGSLWYLRRGQASAAVPGTSNHGWAKAIDAGVPVNRFGSDEHDWMRQWADDAGWIHPVWAHDGTSRGGTDEPWHFEYPTAFTVTRPVGPSIALPPRPTPALPAPAPLQPLEEVDDMYGPAEHAELMAALRGLGAQVAQANDTAAAATREAQAATVAARDAERRAAAAHATAARAVELAGDAMAAARAEGAESRQRIGMVAHQLADVKARMPRATASRYDRPGVNTYAKLAATAEARGLTYADLTPALVNGGGLGA